MHRVTDDSLNMYVQLIQMYFKHVQASRVYNSWDTEWAAVSAAVGFTTQCGAMTFMTPQPLLVFGHKIKTIIISEYVRYVQSFSVHLVLSAFLQLNNNILQLLQLRWFSHVLPLNCIETNSNFVAAWNTFKIKEKTQ